MVNLIDLNAEQLEAVKTTEGYVRVIAGAGSGKTKALTTRYAYLVDVAGISPQNILCVTFTNKAASVMKKRVQRLIGETGLEFICTFHGFCHHLLKRDIPSIGYPKNFVIIDEEDQKDIIKDVFEEIGLTARDITYRVAKERIESYKQSLKYIDFLIDASGEKIEKAISETTDRDLSIIFHYLKRQRRNYALDFNDLINFALYILNNNAEIRTYWQNKFLYIMVDEYQDVSGRQCSIAEILSDYHNNLFVVGDPDQTIYSWRGARVEYILDFDKRHPGTKTITMNQNYRSVPEILQASNTLIAKNKQRIEKALFTTNHSSIRPIYFHAPSDDEEAKWIVESIKKLLEKGLAFSDIAILYRAHHVSRHLEEALMLNDIPYDIYSGIAFYQRKEIKDALAYLRLVMYGKDLDFLRIVNVPKRGLGNKRLQVIKDYAEKKQCSLLEAAHACKDVSSLKKTGLGDFLVLIEKYRAFVHQDILGSELLTLLLQESGLEDEYRFSGDVDRLDNLAELKNSILNFERLAGEGVTIDDFLSHVALVTSQDKEEKRSSIKLMTIHVAKGMEFPCVFVCGLSEGIFPSSRIRKKAEMEEERRLAYVAFTRAERFLYLSDAEGTTFEGRYRMPSRFIFNTEKQHLDYVQELSAELIESATDFIIISEKELDSKGKSESLRKDDKVTNPVFGNGIVIETLIEKKTAVVKFENGLIREVNLFALKPITEE